MRGRDALAAMNWRRDTFNGRQTRGVAAGQATQVALHLASICEAGADAIAVNACGRGSFPRDGRCACLAPRENRAMARCRPPLRICIESQEPMRVQPAPMRSPSRNKHLSPLTTWSSHALPLNRTPPPAQQRVRGCDVSTAPLDCDPRCCTRAAVSAAPVRP